MFIYVVGAWLLLAGFVFVSIFVLALGHFILIRPRRKNRGGARGRLRIPGYFIAAGLALVQLMSGLYSPGAAFLLEEIRDEDADEDDEGDPESLQRQLSRQLKRVRRGEKVGDLVLRL